MSSLIFYLDKECWWFASVHLKQVVSCPLSQSRYGSLELSCGRKKENQLERPQHDVVIITNLSQRRFVVFMDRNSSQSDINHIVHPLNIFYIKLIVWITVTDHLTEASVTQAESWLASGCWRLLMSLGEMTLKEDTDVSANDFFFYSQSSSET